MVGTIAVLAVVAVISSAIAVFTLQLMVIYVPFMRSFFGVVSLSGLDLLIALGTGALVLVAMEGEKLLKRN